MKAVVFYLACWTSIVLSNSAVQAKSWSEEEIIAYFNTGSTTSDQATTQQTPEKTSTPGELERTRSWGATRSIAMLAETNHEPRPTALVPAAAQSAPRSLDMEVQFDFASAQLSAESYTTLESLAGALNNLTAAGRSFAIVGHTDGTGNELENLKLSTLRASAVFNYLTTQQHLSPDYLYVQGKGESALKFPEAPEHPQNRRVQIIEISSATH